MKKLVIYLVGALILSPIILGPASGNLLFAASTIIYAVILFAASMALPKVRKFWRNFAKTLLSFANFC